MDRRRFSAKGRVLQEGNFDGGPMIEKSRCSKKEDG